MAEATTQLWSNAPAVKREAFVTDCGGCLQHGNRSDAMTTYDYIGIVIVLTAFTT
jgi:hypothetical protein